MAEHSERYERQRMIREYEVVYDCRVDQMNIRRNPAPATKPCIRCKHAPAEQNRTRCGPCQAELENEIAHGQRSPAMAAAVNAARRRVIDGYQ